MLWQRPAHKPQHTILLQEHRPAAKQPKSRVGARDTQGLLEDERVRVREVCASYRTISSGGRVCVCVSV